MKKLESYVYLLMSQLDNYRYLIDKASEKELWSVCEYWSGVVFATECTINDLKDFLKTEFGVIIDETL